MELPLGRTVTRESAEFVHRRAQQIKDRWERPVMERAMRAARAQDPKLLFVLERIAETLDQMAEEQMGRVKRDAGTVYSERVLPTEVSLWREAYTCADRGSPLSPAAALYAAAGEFAGIV